jgi:hypothetical protein
MATSFSPNVANENGEETKYFKLSKEPATPEEENIDKNSQDVLVIPFGPTIGESVGLLSEQKVYAYINVIDLLYIIHLSFLYCSFVEDLKKN